MRITVFLSFTFSLIFVRKSCVNVWYLLLLNVFATSINLSTTPFFMHTHLLVPNKSVCAVRLVKNSIKQKKFNCGIETNHTT